MLVSLNDHTPTGAPHWSDGWPMMLPTEVGRLAALVDSLPPREQLNLLLRIGVPASDVMGVDECVAHLYGKPMHDAQPLTFDYTSLWCRGCRKWWTV